jgi:hypothetical protein
MQYSNRFDWVIKEVFGWASSKEFEDSGDLENDNIEDFGQFQMDDHLLRLGDTYIQLRNYRSAMHCFLEAARINPGNAMALNRLVVIPSFFFEKDGHQNNGQNGAMDETDLETLTMNDVFRQTFIGGPVILSRLVSGLPLQTQKWIFKQIQNLDNAYFESHDSLLRDHGPLLLGDTAFYWMINRCYSSLTKPKHTFPVLIITTHQEHGMLKALFRKMQD